MSITAGVRRLAAAGVGSALLASGVLTMTAGQAHAAAPICTKTVTKWSGSFSGPAAAAANGSLDCQLGPGNSSPAVKALQNSLRRCNSASLDAVDGIYGPQTKAAVAKLQRSKGVSPADGLYGPKTRKVFDWLVTGPQGAACATF
ncbi:peptidoglycan-binding domain-containing protein [Streptomyces silaceus]|uniref:peptidoglycan-binding domain-containing protein n=1 Tax=Streptomyces silaceus TaxID=545123 RepID=UPI0006EB6879|nr:peptidoglycan-binding domain-containing protein [Streptomyces silaceus]